MTDLPSAGDSMRVLSDLVGISGCTFAIVFTSDGILQAWNGIGHSEAAAYTAICHGQFRRDPELVSKFGPDAPSELHGVPSRARTFLRTARPGNEDCPAWFLLVETGSDVDDQAIDCLIANWSTMISEGMDRPGNLERPPPPSAGPPGPR
ncbi:hypothetical protein CU254_41400 (plasmid) [Amycolatopsis sp. AA4]|uniref:hypothetical protein n=1 Tax=Actinomycetes TaxID=1760 RepID=UPI0001B556D1|nr:MULTISPECIES: hypothetical protein [Actinomycetes]ATY17043.1 hypothetical protein CU254_41400 [Amycolatopsis sp. AA4]EFL12462.1 predicted protein [Streptomyces sp. AA4]